MALLLLTSQRSEQAGPAFQKPVLLARLVFHFSPPLALFFRWLQLGMMELSLSWQRTRDRWSLTGGCDAAQILPRVQSQRGYGVVWYLRAVGI